MSNDREKKGSFIALLPLIIFVFLFIGTGVITKDFSNMPLNVAVIIASAVALMMNRKARLINKIEIFTKGAAGPISVLMALFFLLPVPFSAVLTGSGAVSSA